MSKKRLSVILSCHVNFCFLLLMAFLSTNDCAASVLLGGHRIYKLYILSTMPPLFCSFARARGALDQTTSNSPSVHLLQMGVALLIAARC